MLNGMKLIGHITPKSSAEIASSRFGIGLEKIDRYLYDPTPVYDPLAQTGVKYVRIQSGWMRTEKEKGVYDWNWIDDIVDQSRVTRHGTMDMPLLRQSDLVGEGGECPRSHRCPSDLL